MDLIEHIVKDFESSPIGVKITYILAVISVIFGGIALFFRTPIFRNKDKPKAEEVKTVTNNTVIINNIPKTCLDTEIHAHDSDKLINIDNKIEGLHKSNTYINIELMKSRARKNEQIAKSASLQAAQEYFVIGVLTYLDDENEALGYFEKVNTLNQDNDDAGNRLRQVTSRFQSRTSRCNTNNAEIQSEENDNNK